MSNRQAAKTPPGRFPLFWYSSRLFFKRLEQIQHIFSNRLQSEPISCIVSDGKAQGFAFFILNIQFHIAIRCTVTEACRPAGFGARERENHSTGAVRTRPFRSSESCLGESQSLRIYPREGRKRARKQRVCFQSASQKNCCLRRIRGGKDECVGRALPVAFGTGAPFFLTGKAAYFVSLEIRPPFCQNGGLSFLPKPSAPPVSAPI